MATLSLSPHVLAWAANKVGLSLDDLARKVAAPSKVRTFIEGNLTPSQAEKVASVARVPFGFLFLAEPPALDRPQLPDLRQIGDAEPLSEAFYETLVDILRKQDWFADHLRDAEAKGPAFVGRYAGKTAENLDKIIAAEITSVLGITPEVRRRQATIDSFYSFVSEKFEAAGILVFKNGVVRSSNKRPLPVAEFRGFAISDPLAPVIFVNGRDWPSAWVFTLIHEAAHIWLGHSGVSDVSPSTAHGTHGVEALCNRIAAEVLTPGDEFLARWKAQDASHLVLLSRYFRVSQLVIARRAYDFGLISKEAYQAASDASKKAAAEAGGGGDGYSNILVRNSKRLTRTVVARAMVGEMMLRDAGSLLNASPRSVVELARRG